MTVETQVSINAPRETVWAAVTDICNAAEIISGIEKTEIIYTPAEGLTGLKWKETRMYFGKPETVEKQVTESVLNKYYKTKAETGGFEFETTMTITEAAGLLYLVSSHKTRARGIAAKIKSLPMVFFKGMIKKAIQKDLYDIKKAAEKNN